MSAKDAESSNDGLGGLGIYANRKDVNDNLEERIVKAGPLVLSIRVGDHCSVQVDLALSLNQINCLTVGSE
jgi:hypothetical protein